MAVPNELTKIYLDYPFPIKIKILGVFFLRRVAFSLRRQTEQKLSLHRGE
jgi:hypothetical protein